MSAAQLVAVGDGLHERYVVADDVVEIHYFYVCPMDGAHCAFVTLALAGDRDELANVALPLSAFEVRAA